MLYNVFHYTLPFSCDVWQLAQLSFFSVEGPGNIVLSYGSRIRRFLTCLFYFAIVMYLLVYPSLSTQPCAKGFAQSARQVAVGVDFITPDGTIVPRAAGEAALLGHTAVLIGGLLVGCWS